MFIGQIAKIEINITGNGIREIYFQFRKRKFASDIKSAVLFHFRRGFSLFGMRDT